jgi:hypothetical protein
MGCLKHFATKWKRVAERNRKTMVPRVGVGPQTGGRPPDGARVAVC